VQALVRSQGEHGTRAPPPTKGRPTMAGSRPLRTILAYAGNTTWHGWRSGPPTATAPAPAAPPTAAPASVGRTGTTRASSPPAPA